MVGDLEETGKPPKTRSLRTQVFVPAGVDNRPPPSLADSRFITLVADIEQVSLLVAVFVEEHIGDSTIVLDFSTQMRLVEHHQLAATSTGAKVIHIHDVCRLKPIAFRTHSHTSLSGTRFHVYFCTPSRNVRRMMSYRTLPPSPSIVATATFSALVITPRNI